MRYKPEEDNDTDFYNKVLDAGRSTSFKILDQYGTNLTDKIQSGQIIAAIDRGFARQFIMKMKEIAGIKQIGVNSRYPYNLLLSLMIVRYFLNFIIIILGFVRLGYWGIAFIPVVILINYLLQASSQVPELKYLFPKLVIFITALGSIYFLIYNTQEWALLIIAIAFHIISITYIITYNYPTKYIKGLILKHPRLIKVLIEEDVVYLIEKSPIINSKPLNKSNDQNSIKPDLPIASDNMQIVSNSEIDIENYEIREWWNSLDDSWKDNFMSTITHNEDNLKRDPSDYELKKIILIEKLDISSGHIDLQPLFKLKHLISLSGKFNYLISSLKGIEDLTELRGIELYSSSITDLEPLRNLLKLNYLNIKGSGVEDLEPILKLPNLKYLSIRECPIKEINQLSKIENLVFLDCSNCEINVWPRLLIDMIIFRHLKQLTHIDCQYSFVKNLEALINLPKLKYIKLKGSGVPESRIKELSSLMPDCIFHFDDLDDGISLFYINSVKKNEKIEIDLSWKNF